MQFRLAVFWPLFHWKPCYCWIPRRSPHKLSLHLGLIPSWFRRLCTLTLSKYFSSTIHGMSTKTKKYPPLKKRHSKYLHIQLSIFFPTLFFAFGTLPTYMFYSLLTNYIAKPCKYFQFGLCTNTAEECNFAHVSVMPSLTFPPSMQGLHGLGRGHGECSR